MSLGDRILDGLLRRLEASRPLLTDLVLVVDHPVLEDTSSSFDHAGNAWRFVRVRGELALRDALPEGDRLVAAVPATLGLPLDLRARAWLNRALEVRAEDVVGAMSGRPCAPLGQGEVARAVMESHAILRAHSGNWTVLGGIVSEREIRAVLVAATLGSDQRLGREAPHQLLARWLEEGAPPIPASPLWRQSFQETWPEVGEWLATAAEQHRVGALVTAGALAATVSARALAPAIPGLSGEREWRTLAELVERALESILQRSPARLTALLSEAEGIFHHLRLSPTDSGRHRLLRGALETGLHAYAQAAADGKPVDEAEIGVLRRNLHASSFRESIALVEGISRIARFVDAAEQVSLPPTVEQWIMLGLREVGWVDLEMRRVRHCLQHVSGDLLPAAHRVVERALAVRDGLNRRFAQLLSAHWSDVSALRDLRRPLPLHQLSRMLLGRLVEEGRRVLLVVLDGCDVSTFLELLEGLPEGLGLAVPQVTNGSLAEDFRHSGPLLAGISPLPTVTSHARRALFAGDIPGNSALDDSEAVAANASGDRQAFAENLALGQMSRTLLLKGDLDPTGEALKRALAQNHRLVAVVINTIDDALSSKETTPLGPWRLENLGYGLRAQLEAAIQAQWTVVLTADHGHTPHWGGERKARPRALGHRYSTEPVESAVRFEGPRIPRSPLWMLTDVGSWHGPQRRGYHGGAGLEEVVVPIALLGKVRPGEGWVPKPRWWMSQGALELAALPPVQKSSSLPVPPPTSAPVEASRADARAGAGGETRSGVAGVSEAMWEVLRGEPRGLQALGLLAEHHVLTASQLASRLTVPAFLLRGTMSRVAALLSRAGLEPPFRTDEDGHEMVYRWKLRT